MEKNECEFITLDVADDICRTFGVCHETQYDRGNLFHAQICVIEGQETLVSYPQNQKVYAFAFCQALKEILTAKKDDDYVSFLLFVSFVSRRCSVNLWDAVLEGLTSLIDSGETLLDVITQAERVYPEYELQARMGGFSRANNYVAQTLTEVGVA